ncbi:hypothetical protein [Tsukamurella tyrosinosolvens]|nr:hypothetical protein [Tsukamurella tyrosinosolvens]
MTLQLACDDCGESEELGAAMMEGNLTADLDPAELGWLSLAGEDFCPSCAPAHDER